MTNTLFLNSFVKIFIFVTVILFGVDAGTEYSKDPSNMYLVFGDIAMAIVAIIIYFVSARVSKAISRHNDLYDKVRRNPNFKFSNLRDIELFLLELNEATRPGSDERLIILHLMALTCEPRHMEYALHYANRQKIFSDFDNRTIGSKNQLQITDGPLKSLSNWGDFNPESKADLQTLSDLISSCYYSKAEYFNVQTIATICFTFLKRRGMGDQEIATYCGKVIADMSSGRVLNGDKVVFIQNLSRAFSTKIQFGTY